MGEYVIFGAQSPKNFMRLKTKRLLANTGQMIARIKQLYLVTTAIAQQTSGLVM